jgi:Nucleotidyltransferase of unknown function (DUF6036)
VPDIPLNASEILACLGEVAEALPPTGTRHTIVVVGGSLLALHGLRQTTLDVDTVWPIEEELREAVARVARVHDLAPAWLNDSSAAFRPQTFVERDCEVLLDRARLLVLGAPLRQVFVMKLFAARVRTRDYDDMVAMWPGCGFDSAEQVVELYRAAYPHEAEDPYLVEYVRGLAH